MAPRATWKGHMKLSLVSFSVRIYNATSSSAKVSLNQLHKDCHQRLRQKLSCPEHGEVDRSEIVKGYEFEKGRYVVIDEEDLDRVQLETTKTIDVEQFVDKDELDPIYLNAPYYVAPDGAVSEEAFRVIREALVHTGKVGLGRFVIAGKEHLVAIEPRDRGLLMTTIRSQAEVRSSAPYFEEIHDGDVDAGQLKLAEQLVAAATAPLDTGQFRDRYQDALLNVIKAKVEGREPAVIQAETPAQSFSFMEALKKSVADSKKPTKKKPPARSVKKKKAAVSRKKKA